MLPWALVTVRGQMSSDAGGRRATAAAGLPPGNLNRGKRVRGENREIFRGASFALAKQSALQAPPRHDHARRPEDDEVSNMSPCRPADVAESELPEQRDAVVERRHLDEPLHAAGIGGQRV